MFTLGHLLVNNAFDLFKVPAIFRHASCRPSTPDPRPQKKKKKLFSPHTSATSKTQVYHAEGKSIYITHSRPVFHLARLRIDRVTPGKRLPISLFVSLNPRVAVNNSRFSYQGQLKAWRFWQTACFHAVSVTYRFY